MTPRAFPEVAAQAVSAAVEARSALVEKRVAQAFAGAGPDECRALRIDDMVWTTHELLPASERERLRLRALGCSCGRQAAMWRAGL